ncbi:MAG: C69 family dipeptidase [Bacteroidota bacterium]|nr:C69 family dipeptidase [Bacteroidota bacterium]
MKKLILTALIVLMGLWQTNQACTNFLITKGASTDGSVMISYSADSHVLYGELYYWPATDWPAGSMLKVYEWDTGKYLGEIPQVPHTYNVVGNMNEYQVSIGETTYTGRKELGSQAGAIMDYGSLMYIALQRSKTAREAIQVIADLMDEFGYYSTGESFSVADKNEAWIMELIGKGEGEKGAVWVARKIPDGYISGHANQARITTFPLDDKENTLYAEDVITFAREKGWYKGTDKNFSFSGTYAPVDFGGARFCEIRVWSMFKDVNNDMQQYFNYAKGDIEHNESFEDGRSNPNGYATNRMPLWIKPERKISQRDMFNFMRDHLEGTELDMRQDVGAGPFERPYRWRPLTWEVDGEHYCNERATATQQTGFSFIAQSRNWLPDEIGGIFWFSVDDAASTVYTPLYTSMTRAPETFEKGNGSMMEWSDNSAFWVFNQVSNLAYLRYNAIQPEVDSLQQIIEKKNVANVAKIDQSARKLYKNDKKAAVKFLTNYSVKTADKLVGDWKNFYRYLFMKYMDGNVKRPNPGKQNPHLKQPGYGNDFYKEIIKDTGDKFKMPGGGH